MIKFVVVSEESVRELSPDGPVRYMTPTELVGRLATGSFGDLGEFEHAVYLISVESVGMKWAVDLYLDCQKFGLRACIKE